MHSCRDVLSLSFTRPIWKTLDLSEDIDSTLGAGKREREKKKKSNIHRGGSSTGKTDAKRRRYRVRGGRGMGR